MASRQAVLLTPLESSHPRPLPSRHRISRVHPAFCRNATFLFSCTSRNPFCNPFVLNFMQEWGYPPSRQKSRSILAQARGFPVPLSLLEATLTENRGEGVSFPIWNHSASAFSVPLRFVLSTPLGQTPSPLSLICSSVQMAATSPRTTVKDITQLQGPTLEAQCAASRFFPRF